MSLFHLVLAVFSWRLTLDSKGEVPLYPLGLAAPIAQSVERFHGKEKVNGSIPFGGSDG